MNALLLPSRPLPRQARLLRWLLGILLPLVIVGAIAEDVFEHERFAFETPTLLWIHAHAAPALTQLSLFLHRFGEPPIMGMVFAGLTLALWLSRRREQATFAFFGLGSAVALTFFMKLLFDRPRPELWPRLVQESGASFPSGHSTVAAALATCVTLLLWHTRWRWPVLALSLAYAVLSGYARLVLGVHFPTDVLAGELTGLLCVVAAHDLVMGRSGRRA